jgi:hypothetical protein
MINRERLGYLLSRLTRVDVGAVMGTELKTGGGVSTRVDIESGLLRVLEEIDLHFATTVEHELSSGVKSVERIIIPGRAVCLMGAQNYSQREEILPGVQRYRNPWNLAKTSIRIFHPEVITNTDPEQTGCQNGWSDPPVFV